ncbi:unnamed protein product [Nippostrongylus brasiliensis]|uniref:Secreted protein n=1 Tax=Nippostrongylus brasiliensis TaxID=27835 RepID=A0A0N4YNW7_NIPBR|nr:unnamed protein product [Nippostrongylus brasiliensis]
MLRAGALAVFFQIFNLGSRWGGPEPGVFSRSLRSYHGHRSVVPEFITTICTGQLQLVGDEDDTASQPSI